jgi:hypothetical protein
MPYNSAGLYALQQTGRKTLWALDTVDIVGDADATGYITDASTAGSGKGAPGKGMQLGDMVFVTVVDSVANPTTISDTGWYYVSAINATTGAGTITACGAS